MHRVRSFFFFNDTATTEIYTLSLHDALPICGREPSSEMEQPRPLLCRRGRSDAADSDRTSPTQSQRERDRKSTRLNSSHPSISYAVFCLKKKKRNKICKITIERTKMPVS